MDLESANEEPAEAESADDEASADGSEDGAEAGADDAEDEQASEPDPEPVVDPPPDEEPDPPPPVLDGATYCEKYNNYVAEADQYFASDDELAFIGFLRRAVADLAGVAPPEVRADWDLYVEVFDQYSDAEMLGDDSVLWEGVDAQLDAADDSIVFHARTVCGADV